MYSLSLHIQKIIVSEAKRIISSLQRNIFLVKYIEAMTISYASILFYMAIHICSRGYTCYLLKDFNEISRAAKAALL